MARSRTVGKGRGSVHAGGRVYLEGATIPGDVEVGDHVFTDADDVEGNVAVTTVAPVTAATVSSGDGPADGTVDEVLDRVGDDQAAALAALEAEQAKAKPRATLVEKLQAVADGGAGS